MPIATYYAEHKQISNYKGLSTTLKLQQIVLQHRLICLFLLPTNNTTCNKLAYKLFLHTFNNFIQSEISSVPTVTAPDYTCS